MSHKILVIDDDARLQGLVTRYLNEQGFSTSAASDGVGMYQLLQRAIYHLYILDVNLPNEDGLIICKRLRASGDKTPIIMLTARGEEVDRIIGLELGADDYLAKPFNPRELLARIRSVLRRYDHDHLHPHATEDFAYKFGEFTLNGKNRELLFNEKQIPLSHNEFTLLKILIQNKGQAISRTQLSARIYGREQNPEQREIDMLISRLRKRLNSAGHIELELNYIQTVRGIGYIFVTQS